MNSTQDQTAALCFHRTNCRLCGSRALEKVLALTPTPPANAFVPAAKLGEPQAAFPLDLFLCLDCGHAQLLDVVDPRVLFEHYVYVSGTSPVFVRHFENYAADLLGRLDVPAGGLVIDIGSNDGTLLGCFKKAGLRVLGIDPAQEIAAAACANGIETKTAFFTPDLAADILKDHGAAKLITANNVFAHADDLAGILAGVRTLLAPDGLFAFEVSYLLDVVEKTLFDTIYHEHLSYHSVKPLVQFLAANGLELIEAIRVDSHGGSLRGIAQRKGGPSHVGDSVATALAEEARVGLDKAETFHRFARNIQSIKEELGALLHRLKAEGKSVGAFGAPAKATTLMYHFGIGPEIVNFIVDDSPLKQGLYSPGMHIPVVPGSELTKRRTDYLVLLAWNFSDPIIAKNTAFTAGGGHFIVPLPAIKVV